MKKPVIIIGVGELGTEFSRGFLRCGYPVYPVTRKTSITDTSQKIPDPALVLITVQEHELNSVLEQLPECWKNKVGLLQNELLPYHWEFYLTDPTVAVVWFEKKPEMVLTNILDTPVYGPQGHLLIEALNAISVPNRQLKSAEDLLYELVRKSLYIFTVNICGLHSNCTVGDLWEKHQALAIEVAEEVLSIQGWLTKTQLPKNKLIAGMVEGIMDKPNRFCLGRSAPTRLKRILAIAQEVGLDVPKLKEINENQPVV